MKYSGSRIVVVVLIVLSTIAIDIGWKFYAEKSARITAKFNLQQAKSCVNNLLLDSTNTPAYSINIDNTLIEKVLKICAQEMKVTTTGDMFAFNLRTLEFVFDPSLDCYVEGGKKMTPESECSLHQDPKKCKEILKEMNGGYDSDIHKLNWWKFDDSREYLEWVILPSESIGFDGIYRNGIIRPNQILLAQGVQEDELWARYSGFRMILYGIGFLSIIINLLIAVHENMVTERKLHECTRDV